MQTRPGPINTYKSEPGHISQPGEFTLPPHYPSLEFSRPRFHNRSVRRVNYTPHPRRETMAGTFVQTPIPQQKPYNGVRFPAVLSPSPAVPFTLSALTKTIEAQRPYLEALLRESGAVLFRGFPLNSASDFNDVVEAFGFEELPYVGGIAPRTNVVGRVFTANESPPDRKIPFHHEMAQVYSHVVLCFFRYGVGG